MTIGKSFIAGEKSPVEKFLKGCLLRDPTLGLIMSEKVLYRGTAQSNRNKVQLISGGGSGHEPAHAGYLGEGALDAVVAGEIFASPSSTQVLEALRIVSSSSGSLLIVKNYTGDKLNFGLAAQKAKAEGRNVNMVIVGDDVSVENNSLVGQRGLAGVVFIHKVAGASAAQGTNLEGVTRVVTKAASQMATVAVSLDRCNVPGRVQQEGLPSEEIEYGLGIHNEPGVKRESLPSLQSAVKKTLDMMFTPKAGMWHPVSGYKVAALVNNLGGLSVLELGVITTEVLEQLNTRDIVPSKLLSGTFVTSLDGPGFSITLLKLDDELESLLDAPTTAPAWPKAIDTSSASNVATRFKNGSSNSPIIGEGNTGVMVSIGSLRALTESILLTTTRDEPLITEYDTLAGDGDCGETLLNGVNGLVLEFKNEKDEQLDIETVFRRIAATAERAMGGTSGAIYAIFLNAVANNLAARSKKQESARHLEVLLSLALADGLGELCKYTPARIGHRTLMDALIPFVEAFALTLDFNTAVAEAAKGAEGTRKMAAALGRASYVGQERFDEKGGVPDPGALGVVSILSGVQNALASS